MKIDPQQDPKLTPEQMASLKTLLHRTIQLVGHAAGMNRTCLSCRYFNESSEACTFYNPAIRPPARVIVEACPAWEDAGNEPF
jgi:hypothetical protein